MGDTTLILLSAGSSSRFGDGVKKQWLRIGEKPLWQFVADRFEQFGFFEKIIITASKEDLQYMQRHGDYTVVKGGKSRQESLKNALKEVNTPYVIVSDVARSCIDEETIWLLLQNRGDFDVVVPYISVSDTVVYQNETIKREDIKRIQTPQISKTKVLIKALQTDKEFTDESSAIVAIGGKRGFIVGSPQAEKLTYKNDIVKLSCLEPPADTVLSGTGFDVHAFDVTKSYLFLCGEKIECGYGFEAHSDGDVAIHALIDALLGASGLGDIGELFPDTDETYAGIDSKDLLRNIVLRLTAYGFEIANVDLTIIAEQPKLLSYKDVFRKNIAKLCHIPPVKANIKATTTEKLGFIGRKEGVAVLANANLRYYKWMKQR